MTELVPPFHMDVQEHSEWCWAAVAGSIKNWSIRDGSAPVKQCEVVAEVRKAAACDAPAAFNRPDRLHLALQELKIFKSARARSRAKFSVIRAEIDSNRPVCARLLWDTDRNGWAEGAHFVVIGGYSIAEGQELIRVFDPAATGGPRVSDWPYEKFKTQYQSRGIWVDTYFVKV